MLLTPDKSLCQPRQKTIVSRDKGHPSEHRANNIYLSEVRHYRLDGDLVHQQKCCDFLLMNDNKRNAYFIELKGENLDEAIPQLEHGHRLCADELRGYAIFYRIVCSIIRTHGVRSNAFRKFQAKCRCSLKFGSGLLQENI